MRLDDLTIQKSPALLMIDKRRIFGTLFSRRFSSLRAEAMIRNVKKCIIAYVQVSRAHGNAVVQVLFRFFSENQTRF